MTLHRIPALTLAALLAPAALATDITYVADTSDDRIYRMRDLDGDGDYNDFGEVTEFYDNASGPYPMTSPNGVVVAPDGTLYVCDSNSDLILAMKDLNGNGDAMDPGEVWVYFDGTQGGNPGGVLMVAANGLTLDAQGRVWVASSNQILSGQVTGDDMILLLEDLNGDGDANDAGEARVFHAPALGTGAVGDSIPTSVKVGLDGAVYYAENGVSGVVAKAIWRLEDLDGSGAIDQPGEATVFFAIPPGAFNIFLWDVEQGADGAWYVSDRGNEIVWRAFDANGNGVIEPGEFVAWFTGSPPSDLWAVRFASDGSVYGCEAVAPRRIRRFDDANGNGVIDPSEVLDLYDDTQAFVAISGPRCLALYPDYAPPTTYCTAGTSSNGCQAALAFSGSPSVSSGAGFLVSASGVEGQRQGVFFYGASGAVALPWGVGTSFLCVKPPTQRLPLATSGGTSGLCDGALSVDWLGYVSSNPGVLGTPLSAGQVFNLQAWYRDPPAPKSTHLSNALEFAVIP